MTSEIFLAPNKNRLFEQKANVKIFKFLVYNMHSSEKFLTKKKLYVIYIKDVSLIKNKVF